MTANIHIINGDLEMAAASIDSIRDGFHGLDAIGAMNGAESAMPASASSGAASGAAAALNDLTAALVGRYGRTSSGTRRLLSIHRSNDEAVAASLPGPSGPTAESTSQWAREGAGLSRWRPGRMYANGAPSHWRSPRRV